MARLDVVIVPLKVHYKSTPNSAVSWRVNKKIFNAVQTARVASLSGLKTLDFPYTTYPYEVE
jgi:hypothetical protein